MDSKTPSLNFREFLLGEVRYSALQKQFPSAAELLFAKTEADAMERLDTYRRLAGLQEELPTVSLATCQS